MSDASGTSDDAGLARTHWRTIMVAVVALLGAAVLTALIVTLGNANRERDRALSLQARSFDVMILTRTLAGTMARAEATLGRFVISGDKEIGRQYFDQWVQAGQQIDRLDELTDDNPTAQRQIAQLRAAYDQRGSELSLIALSTNYQKNDQALARFYQARDTGPLRRIGSTLDALVTSERGLLKTRTGAAMATVERANETAGVFAAFGILLVLGAIVLGWLTVRAIADRAISDAEVEAERERSILLEAAVADATAELRTEAAERAAAEAKLRQMQKLEAVGQLTGGIAHDFNNMLAVVLGGIELAKRRVGDGNDDVTRHLDSAAEGANRASALTGRLLAFARSEPLTPQATDPGALIAGMADLLDRTLGDGVRVEASDVGLGWPIWVDRHGLENAILNLAVNARDAMDGRGTLTVVTGGQTLDAGAVGDCPAGDYATIAVTDTGCGMAADVLDRVFEPFFTTKPVGRGTGLGLSQIFGFVRQSGGEIGLASIPGEGTTVTLYLPRHRGKVAPGDPLAPALAEPRAAHDGLGILVIEDDPRVLVATVEVLVELGHRPVACNDPMTAGAIVATIPPPDLILTDVLMPGKTGPEVIAELMPMVPRAAVLFVTGYAGDAAEQGQFCGHAVLRKPYTIAALTAAIDDAMARRAEAEPPRIASAG